MIIGNTKQLKDRWANPAVFLFYLSIKLVRTSHGYFVDILVFIVYYVCGGSMNSETKKTFGFVLSVALFFGAAFISEYYYGSKPMKVLVTGVVLGVETHQSGKDCIIRARVDGIDRSFTESDSLYCNSLPKDSIRVHKFIGWDREKHKILHTRYSINEK